MNSLFSRIYHWQVVLPFILVVITCYVWVDRQVAAFFYQFPVWYQSPWLAHISRLGSWPLMLAGLIAVYLLLRVSGGDEKKRWAVSQATLSLSLGTCLVFITKILAGRARPFLWIDKGLFGFYGPTLQDSFWSFPSGHTMTIMAIVWSFSLFYPGYVPLWLIIGLLVMATRIILLKHYLTDVLISAYLAGLVVFTVYQCRRQWKIWL